MTILRFNGSSNIQSYKIVYFLKTLITLGYRYYLTTWKIINTKQFCYKSIVYKRAGLVYDFVDYDDPS